MGLFGGGNSSTDVTNNRETNSANLGVNNVQTAGGGVNVASAGKGGSVYLTATDFGAVGKAFGLGRRALGTADKAIVAVGAAQESALDFAGDTLASQERIFDAVLQNNRASAAQFTETLADYATAQNQTNDERLLTAFKWGGGALALIAAASMYSNRRRAA